MKVAPEISCSLFPVDSFNLITKPFWHYFFSPFSLHLVTIYMLRINNFCLTWCVLCRKIPVYASSWFILRLLLEINVARTFKKQNTCALIAHAFLTFWNVFIGYNKMHDVCMHCGVSGQANRQIRHLTALEGDSSCPHSWPFQVYTVTGCAVCYTVVFRTSSFHPTEMWSLTSISSSLLCLGGHRALRFCEPLH